VAVAVASASRHRRHFATWHDPWIFDAGAPVSPPNYGELLSLHLIMPHPSFFLPVLNKQPTQTSADCWPSLSASAIPFLSASLPLKNPKSDPLLDIRRRAQSRRQSKFLSQILYYPLAKHQAQMGRKKSRNGNSSQPTEQTNQTTMSVKKFELCL
jgi:hypothetical protein